ncbi:hypothetical protein [Streptomyces sp. P9-A2]
MSRPRTVIVAAGFAAYRTARTMSRLSRSRADITPLPIPSKETHEHR